MPEKSLQELPRPLREQFDKGMAAFHKDNLDYAVALFMELLRREPACYDAREALRAAQFKRAGAAGGLLKKLFRQTPALLAKGQVVLRTNPVEALHVAEQILSEDPRSNPGHRLLAEAAAIASLPRTAVLSWEILAKHNPDDRDIALRLGAALAAAGQVAKADKVYAELLRANPNDVQVSKAYRDLGARRTLDEKGYGALAGGAGSFRDILHDPAEAVALEQENRSVKTRNLATQLIGEYEARLAREPDNLKLLRSMADLYAQQKDFDGALAALQRIAAAEGKTDPSLEQAIAAVTVERFDHALAQLDPGSPAYAEESARIERERDAWQLEECRSRAERYPTDLQIRFELGQLYLRLGRVTEAIQELQRAQANPHRRIAFLALLGEAFRRRGMFDLAARTLQNAIREKPVLDDEKKELIYTLGTVFEQMGRRDEAVEQFKLIYETDIGYRDVAARVDAHYAAPPG